MRKNLSQPDAVARPTRPELLAPAGDWNALRAAVAGGADAVYFGLQDFNARRRATNFSLAELPEVVAYLHDRNVKGYVTLNTLIFSAELPQATQCVLAIARSGADGVIVQDLGLIRLIHRLAPSLPIHASTQMTQTEQRGIEFLRSLGIRRVILARELSLPEIGELARATTMELEVFVHGALCISYSGQCLASESLFGRSANRGQCAQACRLPYQLEVDGKSLDLPGREYVLSPQDLATYDHIAELVNLGVAGFKIEGRLKSAAYVAAATSVYRAAIDAALQHRPFALSRAQELELAQGFSRGFTHGFLDGVDHSRLVDGRSPKGRGLLVGTVVAKTRRGVVVELAEASATAPRASAQSPHAVPLTSARALTGWPLKPGDGVVFDAGRPDQPEQGGRIFSVDPASEPQTRVRGPLSERRTPVRGPSSEPRTPVRGPQRVELTFGRDDLELAAVVVGSHVWKTDDPAIRRHLERSYRRDPAVHRVALRCVLQAEPGQPLSLSVSDDAGRTVQVTSDEPLAAAEKHPLTVELLREQLGRLGQTPFELAAIELHGPDGPAESLPVMVPKSVLNELRRRAVSLLLEQRAAAQRHEIAEPNALEVIHREIHQHFANRLGALQETPALGTPPQLHVLVRNLEQLDAALRWSPPSGTVAIGVIYCDFHEMSVYSEAVTRAHAAQHSIGLALPRILMPGEEKLLDQLADFTPDVLLVRNLGSLSHLRESHPQVPLIGDFSLNVTNEITAAVLSAPPAALLRLTPSYDLNWPQLRALARLVPGDLLETVLHQHVPMIHTRHCLFAARLSKGTNCGNCGRPCAAHGLHLRDRIGVAHPVLVDLAGRNTVFNARPQTGAEYVPVMLQLGLRDFRLELLDESPEEACALFDAYARLLASLSEPAAALDELRALSPTGITPGTFVHE